MAFLWQDIFILKIIWYHDSSAVRDVHSRAQSARAHSGVLVEICALSLRSFFQVCTHFLRVLKKSAHIF